MLYSVLLYCDAYYVIKTLYQDLKVNSYVVEIYIHIYILVLNVIIAFQCLIHRRDSLNFCFRTHYDSYQRRIHHYRILPNEDGKYSVQVRNNITECLYS